jgi:hypothetical protein
MISASWPLARVFLANTTFESLVLFGTLLVEQWNTQQDRMLNVLRGIAATTESPQRESIVET